VTFSLLTRFQRPPVTPEAEEPEIIPGVHMLFPEEAAELFDQQARKALGISGEEFLRRWDAGEIPPVPDTPKAREFGKLVMLLPWVGRSPL
jgi:hypothetical protein